MASVWGTCSWGLLNIGKYLHDKAEYLVSVSVQQIKQYLLYRISSRNELPIRLTSSPPQGGPEQEMWRTMLCLTNTLPGYTAQTILASLASLARLPAWVILENDIFQPLLLSFKIIWKIIMYGWCFVLILEKSVWSKDYKILGYEVMTSLVSLADNSL